MGTRGVLFCFVAKSICLTDQSHTPLNFKTCSTSPDSSYRSDLVDRFLESEKVSRGMLPWSNSRNNKVACCWLSIARYSAMTMGFPFAFNFSGTERSGSEETMGLIN